MFSSQSVSYSTYRLGIIIFRLQCMITQLGYPPTIPHAVPSRITMAKAFDGPPTIERSGSEHQRAVTSLIPMVGI